MSTFNQRLARDTKSLANLDQDLHNYAQNQVSSRLYKFLPRIAKAVLTNGDSFPASTMVMVRDLE